MNIGDKYEDGGRVLIVDDILPSGKYLTHVVGKIGEPLEKFDLPAEHQNEPEKHNPESEASESTADDLKCRYCGQICKSKAGKGSHERNCKENPANK